MSKKLLIYGLAFGSATAALTYIYLASAVYKGNTTVHILAILAEAILIPGIGIFMFLKSYRDENPELFTIGRGVFGGFFLSVIISAAVSLMYSYVCQYRPELIAQIIDFKKSMYSNGQAALEIKAQKGEQAYHDDINKYVNFLRTEVHSIQSNFKFQLYLGAGRGLFLSAIFSYFMRVKTARSAEKSAQANTSRTA